MAWYLEHDDETYAAAHSITFRDQLDVPASLDQHDQALDAAKAKLVELKSKARYKKEILEPRLIWRKPISTK